MIAFNRISIALHGYLVTCASVQAYVAVSSKTARMDNSLRVCRGSAGFWSRLRLPGPRTFNAMFYALTAVQVGSLLVCSSSYCFKTTWQLSLRCIYNQGADIAFTVSWNKLWSAIESLQSVLQSAEASWLPSSPPDILKLLELNALQETVLQRAKDNVPYQRAVVLVLIVDAFIIAVVSARRRLTRPRSSLIALNALPSPRSSTSAPVLYISSYANKSAVLSPANHAAHSQQQRISVQASQRKC